MLDRAYAELGQGRLFLWNPYQLAGLPGLATLQAGLLYPFHLLYAFVPTEVGMGLMGIAHSLLGGWSMVFLARVLGARPAAALAAGLYFALAVVVSRYSWPPAMEAVAWLPLGIASIERISRNGGVRWMAALVLAAAMPVLAGGYQTSAYMLAAYAWYAVVVIVARGGGQVPPSRGAAVLRIGLCLLLGMAVAAPQLLPTAELAQRAARSTQALPLVELNPFGNQLGSVASAAHAALVPPDALLGVRRYLGVVAVGTAVVGLCVLDRTTFFCLTLILYGLLSLQAPPWFLSLRSAIPVLGWFRLPGREFFLAQFAVALLVARGVSVLVNQHGHRWWGGIAAAAGAACMLLGACYRGGHPSAMVAGGGAVCLLLGWVLGRWRPYAVPIVSLFLALLIAYDTVGFSRNDLQLPYAHDGWRVLYGAEDAYFRLGELAGLRRTVMLTRFDRQTSVKNAQLFGIFSPFDYEPLSPAGHEQCFLNTDPSYPKTGGPVAKQRYTGWPRQRDQSRLLVYPLKRCLDLLSVDIAVVPRSLLLDADIRKQWHDVSQEFIGVKSGRRFVFLRNRSGLPRAYAVYDAECLNEGAEQWQRLLSPEFDPRTTVVLERTVGCAKAAGGALLRGPDVEIVALETMYVRLRTNMGRPGYVVLTDTYYPGWQARVNDEPVAILRANGMLRAVRVPEGPVDIVFKYVPVSFYAGVAVAVGAILFMALGAWVERRHAMRTDREMSEGGSQNTLA